MSQSYFQLNGNKIAMSDQIDTDVIVDYDAKGGIVGIEFLSEAAASKRDHYLALAARPSKARLRAPRVPGKAASAA